jgi:hypothetical protein
MRLSPARGVGHLGHFGRQGHVQASVVRRVQVRELTPCLERLSRSARTCLVEHEGTGSGHRDAALGLADSRKLKRAAGEFLL